MILVLGHTPQERGQQLESLTLELMRLLGYVDCTTNLHSDGSEIDVRGRLPRPSIGNSVFRTLLCECKAHQSPIDMTQWCKFLGKLFHAEALEGHEVDGCFISLSGVNGHVQGHFDSLRRCRDNVSLIHGDRLGELVAQAFKMSPLEAISRHVSRLTERVATSFVTAYFNGSAYWLVGFSDGRFTFLASDGTPISADDVNQLTPMVTDSTEFHTHVDLLAERAAQVRRAKARTHVIATLFKNRGEFPPGIEAIPVVEDYSANELTETARQLIEEGLLTVRSDGVPVLQHDAGAGVTHVPARVYRELFQAACPATVLGCDFYDSGISHALLSEICEIQEGLVLTSDESELSLELLRLSPTGLRTALSPMQMIVESVRQGIQTPEVERFRAEYFVKTLLKCLREDFGIRALGEYFYRVRRLRELDLTTRLVAKSSSATVLDHSFRERIGVGELHESYGGGYVYVSILAEAPEPWEPGGVCIPSADDANETGAGTKATSTEINEPPETP